MKLMFKILCTLFLFTIIGAQTNSMKIHLNNGSTDSFSIQNIEKITFSGVVGIEDAKKIGSAIKTFKLLQNYPNPFNPSTTIEYTLPENGSVNIKIFNINGQLVKDFQYSSMAAGRHKVIWDGKNNNGQKVASGLYVYMAQFENSTIAKKMILIK